MLPDVISSASGARPSDLKIPKGASPSNIASAATAALSAASIAQVAATQLSTAEPASAQPDSLLAGSDSTQPPSAQPSLTWLPSAPPPAAQAAQPASPPAAAAASPSGPLSAFEAVADKFRKKQPASAPAEAASGKHPVAVEVPLPPEQVRPVAEVMWQIFSYAGAAGLQLTTFAIDCVWTSQTMPGKLHTKLCLGNRSARCHAESWVLLLTSVLFQRELSLSKTKVWVITCVSSCTSCKGLKVQHGVLASALEYDVWPACRTALLARL